MVHHAVENKKWRENGRHGAQPSPSTEILTMRISKQQTCENGTVAVLQFHK
jgi:hypothetical protein